MSPARAWAIAVAVTLASAAALALGFAPTHAGSVAMFGAIGGAYLLLAAGCVFWLYRRGELKKQLSPVGGDLFIGALIALALHGVARFSTLALRSTSAEPWFWRLFNQLGDPHVTAAFHIGIAVLFIAALEELVWRGWVMRALAVAHGPRVGLAVSSGLYAVAHLPTALWLADPALGPNPLLPAAALGCGLVWGYLALKIDRLGPSLFSHALFSWSVVTFRFWTPG